VEAAHIAWRPLGRLLVEQGLLTNDELERALAQQQTTGKRLGETIVELGFVSGPDLASALATQYGLELTVETGFGTGLRAQIQRRHENDRGMPGRPALSIVENPPSKPEPGPHADTGAQAEAAEALLLTQLEEQWAKLAAAEEALAESEREVAAVKHERDRRRRQAARLIGRVRDRERQLDQPHEELAHLGRVTDEQLKEVERLTGEAKGRNAEIERLTSEARDRNAEIERLGDDIRGCDAEIERLRQENERLRAQAGRFATRLRSDQEPSDQRGETQAPVPSSHLVFVQLDDGYELVECDGPPPSLATVLELPQLCEEDFVVTRLGRSPLPADTRSCVFVERA
jgi:DNA repair exonuclease SbcCD ATPase subunit